MSHQDQNNQGAAVRNESPKEWKSEDIFARSREIVILHNGEQYKLRLTANNKLILTK